ncbi:zinc finger protein 185 isoform X2 [Sceloporus undulatus]|uniref:zinc finger protein 185 isoform X2 n=1 Tax=Sceloporus undulatus TaxID=8520 RepID=UPI001C4ACF16|nr:zinc finger protein 185 isoform X2 [Sceloporus undulatus]
MLSLSAAKDGVILPSEEDRKRIITQMKVRTTLKGDKSWIQQKSDSEDEWNHSPLHSPLRTTARSPPAPRSVSPNRRVTSTESPSQADSKSSLAQTSPSKKSSAAPSGYLIRGVFTKTIDKSPASNTTSNGSPKSAKNTTSTPRFSQGYKMTTDEYKRLAPYNIKRELSDPGDVEPSVSPDEQKKRTEAASSVLRRTASKERSYVLSAAKKSNGNLPQDAPSFMAKRTDEEDDTGPRSRSQTVPASAWFSSRGKSNNVGSRSQASKPTEPSSTFNHFGSTESSIKPDQGKHKLISLEESTSPSKGSERYDRTSQTVPSAEMQSTTFSETSWETTKPKDAIGNQISQIPHIVISPEASPKKSAMDHRETDSTREFKYQSPSSQVTERSEHQPFTAKTQSLTRDQKDALSGPRYNVPSHFDSDEDVHSKRSFSGFERKTTHEMADESPSDTEYKKVEAHLAKSGSWSSESSLSTSGTQSELLRAARRDESELDTARSSSLSTESGDATPESHQGENGSDVDTARTYYPFRDGLGTDSSRSHRVPFYKDNCDTDNRRNVLGSDKKATDASCHFKSPSGYDSDPATSSKGLLFVKESVNSTELSSSPRYNSRSMVDLSELEKLSYSTSSYLNSSHPKRPFEDMCTYCGREIRNCAKITIDKLKICCHEYCFRCGICHKPMGDLLDKIFIHRDIVHCDKCYEKLF